MLADALSDHLLLRRPRLAPTTYVNEVGILRRFLRDVGNIQCRHLRPEHVERWMTGLLRPHTDLRGTNRPGLGPAAFNTTRSYLQNFLTYLNRRGLNRHPDPLLYVAPMRVPVVVRQQPGLDLIVAMIESAPTARDRAVLAVSAGTALRASSLKLLRVGDVDLDGGYIATYAPKVRLHDRHPITSDLDTELRRWLVDYEAWIGRPLEHDDYLLPAVHGPRFRYVDGVRTVEPGDPNPSKPHGQMHVPIQDGLRRVGLEAKGEGAHTLRRAIARHFFDALSREQGFDGALRVVASLLGHRSTRTTEMYLGISADRSSRDEALRGRSLLRPQGNIVVSLKAV